tara:strand:+ start:440 stop:793 length:354 start_codon:yes stop_codon:yes gene_type:complete
MSRLEIILGIVATISIFFNIGLILYVKGAIVRLLSISEELGDFQQMVDAFANHVKTVYELEMFYGDETLKNLLEHARSFNEQLDTFEYIYSLTEIEEETRLNENTETEQTQEEEEER